MKSYPSPSPLRNHNAKVGLIDVDIHPRPKSLAELEAVHGAEVAGPPPDRRESAAAMAT